MTRTPFIFGIPLIARRAAGDWERIEALLDLTIASILAQTDDDFSVIIAGHDRPRCAENDSRISFLQADWSPSAPDSRNSDGGRKKAAIVDRVLAQGGGLLMFVDGDDWVDTTLVEAVRSRIESHHVGAVIRSGYAIDLATLRTAPMPDAGLFALAFDQVCGSSVIYQLQPKLADPVACNPYSVLHEHYQFVSQARLRELPILELPVNGGYAVSTGENHSELHGPFTEWRGHFCQRVNDLGWALDHRRVEQFGLTLASVRQVSVRLFEPRELAHFGQR